MGWLMLLVDGYVWERLVTWWRCYLARGALAERFLPLKGWSVSVVVACEMLLPRGGGVVSVGMFLARGSCHSAADPSC